MDIKELTALLEEQNPDIKHCPICDMPFKPYHSRQKTCGNEECRKAHKREYYAKWKDGNEEAKLKHRYATWKYMQKVRKRKADERNADAIEEHWRKQKEFDEKVKAYGDRYGEIQKQKTLQSVERIKTEL